MSKQQSYVKIIEAVISEMLRLHNKHFSLLLDVNIKLGLQLCIVKLTPKVQLFLERFGHTTVV